MWVNNIVPDPQQSISGKSLQMSALEIVPEITISSTLTRLKQWEVFYFLFYSGFISSEIMEHCIITSPPFEEDIIVWCFVIILSANLTVGHRMFR